MIEIGIKTIGFFIAVFSFSMLINSPKKYLIWAGFPEQPQDLSI